MHITISKENKVLLEELKEEVFTIKQEVKELSLSLLIQLKTIMLQVLISYREYSLTNIREYGIGEILMNRAMRFFKLDNDYREKKAEKKKTKQATRKGGRYLVKKSAKVILYPFYLIIVLIQMIFNARLKKKSDKYVKNFYRE
jgi:hypothetical protein